MDAGNDILSNMRYAKNVVVLQKNYTPLETMGILKNVDMIVGMRLHSLIMGAAMQKPVIALSYDPKVTSFMNLLRLRECHDVASVTAEQLQMSMQRLQNRSEKDCAQQRNLTEIMARQAKEPVQLLLKLF